MPSGVLFGKRRAYQRKVALAEFDAVVSGDIYVLGAKKDRLLLELLPFLCLSERFFKFAVGTSAGSLSPRTNWSHLAQFELALPLLDQQRHIAGVLSAVDQATQGYESLISGAIGARLAQIDSLIPSPDNGQKGKVFTRLDRVATMQNGRPFPSSEYQETGVRLIRPGNLAPDGTLDWSPSVTVSLSKRFLTENRDWLVNAGQVLINLTAQSLEDGFIGRVCFTHATDSGLLNQRIGRFIIHDEILPRFFFRCLQTTRFRKMVENRCEGSKIRHLYFRHFEDFSIPILSKAEQMEVVEKLDAADAFLSAALQGKSNILALRQSLTDRLVQ